MKLYPATFEEFKRSAVISADGCGDSVVEVARRLWKDVTFEDVVSGDWVLNVADDADAMVSRRRFFERCSECWLLNNEEVRALLIKDNVGASVTVKGKE